MAGQAADLFVSYEAEDRARVQPLVAALKTDGFGVWDTRVGGGAHLRDNIQDHFDAAKCALVMWTKRLIGQNGYLVPDETSRAQRRRVYVAVRVDSAGRPLGFEQVQPSSLSRSHSRPSDIRLLAVADAVAHRG